MWRTQGGPLVIVDDFSVSESGPAHTLTFQILDVPISVPLCLGHPLPLSLPRLSHYLELPHL